MPTKDGHWTFAGLVLDGHPGAEPTATPGDAYDLRCLFTAKSDSPAGQWPDHVARYQSLLEYMPRVGEFVLHDIESGAVGYTETFEGGTIPNNSLVAPLRPPVDCARDGFGRGGWYIIEDMTDETTTRKFCDVGVSVVYLAPIGPEPGAYETRFALTQDLEAPTLI